MEGCWYAKQIGNLQIFNNVGKDEGTTSCYGCVILKNPHWPGWVTTANVLNILEIDKNFWINLYWDRDEVDSECLLPND